MIPITVIVTGKGTVSQKIKGTFGPGKPSKFAKVFKPIVVWNMTYACNMRCLHCYISAESMSKSELSKKEALELIDQLSRLRPPLLILSGGEPLVRKDFLEIAEYASSRKLRLSLSTNGTLLTKEVAKKLYDLGFVYIGISLDSPNPIWHDKFRGKVGAFDETVAGIKNSVEAGLSTGLRYTIMRKNVNDVSQIVNLALNLKICRITFYHLSPAGRAKEINLDWYISSDQYFKFIDYLIEISRKHAGRLEIETTMAPFDGIYVADKVAKSNEEFWRIIEAIEAQGGCGRKIVAIYPDGTVYPCQFVDFVKLGNVTNEPLERIIDINKPELKYFVETYKYLKGSKCASCPFKRVCNGGDRVRAYYLCGDLYGDDPQCFLDVKSIYNRWAH
jgi:radical SAM protein with 4Fe4S-binding SPASM domain